MVSIYWAALISFIAGMCGYIIVRFWVMPIARYRRVKRLLLAELKNCAESLPVDGTAKWKPAPAKKHMRDMRRLGVQLLSLHDGDLPYWYRLMLITRKESPAAAADPLLRLENMPTGAQARQCIDLIGKHLRGDR